MKSLGQSASLTFLLLAGQIANCLPAASTHFNVKRDAGGASPVLPPGFISYSIEFAFFPDFAGNLSTPNNFSNNLLENLGVIQGTKPYIRVGGNTQDYAVFDVNQSAATIGTIIPSISTDYPRILTFGPSYFESYATWPNVKFLHGFNLGHNSSHDREALLLSVPYACKALSNGNLLYYELGNEPDLFKTSAQGIIRPRNWTETSYVQEWLSVKRSIQDQLQRWCPGQENMEWYAPSFAGTTNSLDPIKTWDAGLDADNDISMFSSHNYIGGATQLGITLQNTLMNHTKTVSSISTQLNVSSLLHQRTDIPFILGETNSLYNQGRPGLSNTFGAALWGLDFNLWCASQGIERVHMHMGTNFRYQAWQPVETNNTSKGTKAPYYGQVAAASALGDLTKGNVQVVNLPLPQYNEAAYATYVNSTLARLAVINMASYNFTGDANSTARPTKEYDFGLPSTCKGTGVVQRLIANGSDAITGVTFNGLSYNFELDQGRPVLLGNVTKDETVTIGSDGILKVELPYSSAAIIQLRC